MSGCYGNHPEDQYFQRMLEAHLEEGEAEEDEDEDEDEVESSAL